MKKLLVGIDLGTTYSCAAILNDSGTIEVCPNLDTGSPTTPSALFIKKGESAQVGDPAKSSVRGCISLNKKERIEQMNEGFYINKSQTKSVIEQAKRFIGNKNKSYNFNDEVYNPSFVSAAIIKKIVQDVESTYNQKIDKAVITVPANFNSQERQETLKAANSIGLNVTDLIDEPSAAALAYSVNSQIDGIYVVYDFGGGTFDCSIVETNGEDVKILASEGIKRLGGKDIDLKLLEIIEKKYKEKSGKDLSPRQFSIIEAEESKVKLSTLKDLEIFIDGDKITVTRKEFEEAISTLIAKSMLVFDTAIEQAKISVDNIMDVILVGGSSRIPLVQKQIKNRIGKQPKSFGNPDETVAKGAAVYIALKNKENLNINQKAVVGAFDVKEISNVYLGTVYFDGETEKRKNKTLIKKGARIPASKTETFYIPVDYLMIQMKMLAEGVTDLSSLGDRTATKMEVTEAFADSSALSNVKIVWNKSMHYPNLDRRYFNTGEDGEQFAERWCPLKVKYSIDKNQIFHVTVKHPASGTTMIDENLDMRKGSLNVKGGSKSKKIEEFSID